MERVVAAVHQPSGTTVTSPPARYLQYQAQFTGTSAVPKLNSVCRLLPAAQPAPTVSLAKPAAGDAVSKTATLNWTASDPDKDTLSYDVSYSADGGKTWKPITASAQLKAQTQNDNRPGGCCRRAGVTQKRPGQRAGAVKAQIAANSTASSPTPAKSAQDLKETSYSWDTTTAPDGLYQIEVVASDKPSNPVGPLTAKATSQPFLIANTPPALTLGVPTVNADKTVTLHGIAQTKPRLSRPSKPRPTAATPSPPPPTTACSTLSASRGL